MPGNGPTLAVINPATGKAIAEVTAADVGQADLAMASASRAFDSARDADTAARHAAAQAGRSSGQPP